MKEIMDNGPVQGMGYGCGTVRMIKVELIRWSCTVHLLVLGIPEMPLFLDLLPQILSTIQ